MQRTALRAAADSERYAASILGKGFTKQLSAGVEIA
jgi:hypothetical protein